ncbi:MAG: TMEM175 family protein [Actinomycetota bacterium]|nr:TMEM175 family protein [Actinomycetota bacterium]
MIDRDESPLEFGRVLSLSDAVFGLAMTLLVVSIAIPPGLSSPGVHPTSRKASGMLIPA